jgi:cytochrome c55X
VIKRINKKTILSISFLLSLLLNPVLAHSENDSSENDSSENESSQTPSAERQETLIHLLKQDCGSCHGMTLKGGLGPALLPEALADKPNYVLVGTILYGRETLAMPAWDGILNKSEVEWLVARLKEGIK